MSRPVNDDRAPPSDLPSLVREMEHVMLNVAGLAQLALQKNDGIAWEEVVGAINDIAQNALRTLSTVPIPPEPPQTDAA